MIYLYHFFELIQSKLNQMWKKKKDEEKFRVFVMPMEMYNEWKDKNKKTYPSNWNSFNFCISKKKKKNIIVKTK